MKAAQKRAEEMAKSGLFSHATSTNAGAQPAAWTYMNQAGYQFGDAGENLAEGYKNATDTMTAWQKSPTHNQNLVNPKYSEMGIAVVPGTYKGKKTSYVVHFFGSPKMAQPVVVVPTPQTSQKSQVPLKAPMPIRASVKVPVPKPISPQNRQPVQIPQPRKPTPLFIAPPFANSNSTLPMTASQNTNMKLK